MDILLREERQAEQINMGWDEEARANVQLTVETRRQIVRTLVDFMVMRFGTKPTKYEKISTAKAAITVFPRLMFKESKIGGIVNINLIQMQLVYR